MTSLEHSAKEGMSGIDFNFFWKVTLVTMTFMEPFRPNDYFMEQIVELDNDLRKARECGMSRSIELPSIHELDSLPKPWHFEFWNEIPDDEDLPFQLSHMKRREVTPCPIVQKSSCSKRASMISNASSEWEWEYYDETDEEDEGSGQSVEE